MLSTANGLCTFTSSFCLLRIRNYMPRTPSVPPNVLEKIILSKYQFKQVNAESFKELDSFSDRNYSFFGKFSEDKSFEHFVLKIVNSEDSESHVLVEGTLSAMQCANINNVRCPLPIQTKEDTTCVRVSLEDLREGRVGVKEPCLDGNPQELCFCVFIMTFIEGTQLFLLPKSDRVLYNFGALAGKLNSIWKNFHHPGIDEREPSNWHLQSLPHLCHLLKTEYFRDSELTPLIQNGIAVYEKFVMNQLSTLTWGVIHSDFHDMNVLCHEGDIENMGVVDFMDVSRGPYIFELAGAAMDAMKDRDNPLDGLRPLVQGYTTHKPLPQQELNLLIYAVVGKLAHTILLSVSATSTSDDLKHKDYIMVDCDKAVALLKYLLSHIST